MFSSSLCFGYFWITPSHDSRASLGGAAIPRAREGLPPASEDMARVGCLRCTHPRLLVEPVSGAQMLLAAPKSCSARSPRAWPSCQLRLLPSIASPLSPAPPCFLGSYFGALPLIPKSDPLPQLHLCPEASTAPWCLFPVPETAGLCPHLQPSQAFDSGLGTLAVPALLSTSGMTLSPPPPVPPDSVHTLSSLLGMLFLASQGSLTLY